MKKLTAISSLALMLMVTIILSSCTSVNLQDPKEVGTAFLKYIEDGNLEKAKELCTAKAKDRLDEINKLGQFENNLCKSYAVRDIEDDGKGRENFKWLNFKPDGFNSELQLVIRQENGVWKVDNNRSIFGLITLKVKAFDLYQESKKNKSSIFEDKYYGRIIIAEGILLSGMKIDNYAYNPNTNEASTAIGRNGYYYTYKGKKVKSIQKTEMYFEQAGEFEGKFGVIGLSQKDNEKIEDYSYGDYKCNYKSLGIVRGQLLFGYNYLEEFAKFNLLKAQIDSIN